MMDQAQALLELQEHDLEISRAEKRLEDLPEKVRILELRRKLADVGKLRDKANEACGKLTREIARLEDAIAVTTAKMADEQDKLLSGAIKNHKEVANISTEVDLLRRKKEGFEDELLALIQKRETFQLQVNKIEEALAKGREDEKRLVERFQKAGGDILGEIEKLKKERTKLAKAVDASMLARYEKIRESRHGIAAGRLEGQMCGCCRTTLPAAALQSLKQPGTVGECPNCRRIIVVTAD
jgi:predicted  nucleic acid-binding Zn-ribbon protein